MREETYCTLLLAAAAESINLIGDSLHGVGYIGRKHTGIQWWWPVGGHCICSVATAARGYSIEMLTHSNLFDLVTLMFVVA